MITNEVAFVAIAVSDKERARKFYQETLELTPTRTQMDGAWVEYDLGPITIGVGCHPAWKPSREGPPSRSRWKILMMRTRNSKNAASVSIWKNLKRPFAGWRNFVIPTETSL